MHHFSPVADFARFGYESQTLMLPTSVPGLLGWWDLRRSTRAVNIDGSGGTPGAGAAMGYVSDLSAIGANMAAVANDATRVTYHPLFLGYEFNVLKTASGQRLFSTAAGLVNPLSGIDKPFTIFAVVLLDTEIAQDLVICAFRNTSPATNAFKQFRLDPGLSTTANRPIIRVALRSDAGGGANTDTLDTGAGWGGSGLNVLALVFDGSTYKVYQNNALAGTLTPTNTAGDTFTITHVAWGQSYGGSEADDVGLGPHMPALAIWGRELSATELSNQFRFFQADHRIPWSASPGDKIMLSGSDSHRQRTAAQHAAQQSYRLIQRNGFSAKRAVRIVNRGIQGAALDRDAAHAWDGSGQPPAPDAQEQWDDFKGNCRAGDGYTLISFGNDARLNADIVDDATALTAANNGSAAYMAIAQEAIETKGMDFVGISVSPQDSAATPEHRRKAILYYNELSPTSIKAGLALYDRAWYADTFNSLRSGASPYSLDVAFQVDQLHLNPDGLEIQRAKEAEGWRHLDFDPRDISSLKHWWSARQGSRFLDNAAIGAAGGSELVDRSSTADHAVQATAGERPTFQTAVSGNLCAIQFDGTGDLLDFTETTRPEWTVLFVAKETGNGGDVLGHSSAFGAISFASTAVAVTSNGGEFKLWSLTLADYDIVIVTSDGRCYVNGVLRAVTTENGNFAGSHAITINQIGSGQANGPITGFLVDVMEANEVWSASTMNAIGNYLAEKLTNCGHAKTWTEISG